jgi:hypothetical protein
MILPFSLAVNERAQTYYSPVSTAAYSVIEEIENYNGIRRPWEMLERYYIVAVMTDSPAGENILYFVRCDRYSIVCM